MVKCLYSFHVYVNLFFFLLQCSVMLQTLAQESVGLNPMLQMDEIAYLLFTINKRKNTSAEINLCPSHLGIFYRLINHNLLITITNHYTTKQFLNVLSSI